VASTFGVVSSRTQAWSLVLGVLAIYVVTMLAYYPDVITNVDEACYVAQADGFSRGTVRNHWQNPVEGLPRPYQPGEYPAGTSAVMAPFMFVLGWRGAFVVPLLALLGLVLCTARMIEREGRSPLYSLFVLVFPATLVLGRVAMSDVICAFLTTLSILLFWRGIDQEDRRAWWVSGFIAGLSLTFRETSVLVIIPFFLGAVIRRERGVHALVISGLTGTSLRFISGAMVFGSPFHVKSAGYGFSIDALAANLPMYAFFTLVLVPGGLLAALQYRGRRRPEVTASVLLPVIFFSSYTYAGAESGQLKALILTGRFLIPAVPILAFCLAHVVPEALEWLSKRNSRAARRIEFAAGFLLVVGAASASISVHVFMNRFNANHLGIRTAIYEYTSTDSWVLTNAHGTFKYLASDMYGARAPIGIQHLEPQHFERILESAQDLHVVLLERSDSEYWRRRSVEYASTLGHLAKQAHMQVRYDEHITPSEHLRIWRVVRNGEPSS
jgi:hypothetical protein